MSGSGWHNRSQRSHIIMIFIPGQSCDKNNKLIALIDARHDIRSRERSITIITSDRHTRPLFWWVSTLKRRISIFAGILTHIVWTWVKCMDVKIISDIFFSLPVTSEIYCFHDCLNTWLHRLHHPPSHSKRNVFLSLMRWVFSERYKDYTPN